MTIVNLLRELLDKLEPMDLTTGRCVFCRKYVFGRGGEEEHSDECTWKQAEEWLTRQVEERR